MNNLSHNELSNKIKTIARDLKLQAFEEYSEYIRTDLSTEEVVYNLLKAEQSIKDLSRYRYRMKMAKFPVAKTLDTFHFDTKRLPGLSKDTIMELATCKFIEEKRNVIALGNPGTGKTHLLTALCIEAITKGYSVRFIRASDLVTQMTESKNENELAKYIKKINTCDVLFIDEFGYLSYDAAGASLLYQIFANRYETKSTLVTSNLAFSKWLSILSNDEELASALIGRITSSPLFLT
jgi:DNA replication protein DnaC